MQEPLAKGLGAQEHPEQRAEARHLPPGRNPEPSVASPPPPFSSFLPPACPCLTGRSASRTRQLAAHCNATWCVTCTGTAEQLRLSRRTARGRDTPAAIPLVSAHGDVLSNRLARERAGSRCGGAGLQGRGAAAHAVGGASRDGLIAESGAYAGRGGDGERSPVGIRGAGWTPRKAGLRWRGAGLCRCETGYAEERGGLSQ